MLERDRSKENITEERMTYTQVIPDGPLPGTQVIVLLLEVTQVVNDSRIGAGISDNLVGWRL